MTNGWIAEMGRSEGWRRAPLRGGGTALVDATRRLINGERFTDAFNAHD